MAELLDHWPIAVHFLHSISKMSENVLGPSDQIYEFICFNSFPYKFRYKKFMRMNKEHTGKFFVPMYDIDLVWHTHQHMATSYKRDTEAYFGE